MTDDDAQAKIEEIEAIPEADRTPQQKAALTRARKQIDQAIEAAAAEAAEDAVNELEIPIPDSLVGRLWWVQMHVGHVEKTGKVKIEKFNVSYKHMQEHGLLKVLKPLMAKAYLAFYPTSVTTERAGNHVFAQITYELANALTGETKQVGPFDSEGVDNQDKATNKAFTNGMKYALQKVFLVPTEDIDDVDNNDDTISTAGDRKRKPAANQQAITNPKAMELTARALEAVNEGKLTQPKVIGWLQSKHAVDRVDQLDDAGLREFETWLNDATDYS